RIIFYQYSENNKLQWEFEIWASREAINDHLKNSIIPGKNDLERFGIDLYEKIMDDCNWEPKQFGAYVTSKGWQFGDPNTFPGSLPKSETLVQTNISLPVSLHEQIKSEAKSNNESLSEIIRSSLVQFKGKSFVCSTCGKTKLGEPQIIYENIKM